MTTYTKLLYHLVFSTKEQTPVLLPDLREPLFAYVGGILRNHRGALVAAGGVPDHIHLLVNIRPEPSVSRHLKEIKGSSSRWLKQRRPSDWFGWQAGYGAFSVSPSQVPAVKRHLANQEKHRSSDIVH